jgi:hypothetical protein
MPNNGVYTGFWIDYSRSSVLGATVTLPMAWGSILISMLTVAVTISASAFWPVTAFLLHQTSIHQDMVDPVGLQLQVILRNSGSPLSTLWDLIRVQSAWRKGPRIKQRTLQFAVPALIVWLSFTVASIFVSAVATNGYSEIRVLLKPDNCGFLNYNLTTPEGVLAASFLSHTINSDSRSYAGAWYGNASTVPTIYPVNILPYNTTFNTSCPFDTSRCLLGKTSAFTMTTSLLDSHSMFGFNAPKNLRLQFQKNMTCAVAHVGDLVVNSDTQVSVYAGPYVYPDLSVLTNYTYTYNTALANNTLGLGYMLGYVKHL